MMKIINLPIQKQIHISGQNGIPIRIERARVGRTMGWRLVHGKNQFVTADIRKIMSYLFTFQHRVMVKRPRLRMERIQITDLGDF